MKLAPAALLALALLLPLSAFAEDTKKDDPAPDDIWSRDTLTGDWGGARKKLQDEGITLGAGLIIDAQGNPSGGYNQGAVAMNRLELDLDADFEKIFGVNAKGLTGHINAYSIFGRGLGVSDIGALAAPSNIEAQRASFRLFDAWLQQEMFDGMASLRFGQIAADDEFATSGFAGTFINATFGMPAALAADLPSGGPAYPYATPGIRLRVGENKPWSVQAAVFNGDPTGSAGKGLTPQDSDPSGTSFRLSDNALFMLEGTYALNGDEKDTGLPGTYKLGAWMHTGNFADLREDNTGVLLAAPGSTGIAKNHEDNYGIYAVADQMVWSNGEDREHGLGLFARAFAQPSDRNLASFQGDIGFNLKGMLFGRKDDTLGLGFSYLKISDRQRDADFDANFFNATTAPLHNSEEVLELTYQAQVTPWLIVQPDFQYIVSPGGNAVDPTDPAGQRSIESAAVVGVRTAIKF